MEEEFEEFEEFDLSEEEINQPYVQQRKRLGSEVDWSKPKDRVPANRKPSNKQCFDMWKNGDEEAAIRAWR
jgi:hypothetical protein